MTDDHRPNFYDAALEAADRDLFEEAHHVDGLDDEVALLRLQVRRMLEEAHPDPKVLQSGIRLLIQALAAQHRITGAQAEDLGTAVAGLIERVASITLPLDTTGDAA